MRFARSTGPAVLALFLTGALAAGLPPAAPAGATTTTATGGPSAAAGATAAANGTAPSTARTGEPVLTLDWQTATVQAFSGTSPNFVLDLGIGSTAPAGAEVGVTLYGKLTTRSKFEQTLNNTPQGSPITHTTPVTVSSLPAGQHHGIGLGIDVVTSGSATPPATAGTPALELTCTPTDRSCTGVYPAVISLFRPGQASSPVARLTTYLTYVESDSTPTASLRFAWVVPVKAPVDIRAGARDPAAAVNPPSKVRTAALGHLIGALKAYPQVPATVEAAPQTLQGMSAAGNSGRQAVDALADMTAHDPTTRQVPPQSYVPIDLGALAGAGEGGEITGQMTQGATVLHSLGVQTGEGTTTWVATGPVGSALGTGLAQPQVGAKQVVVPDTTLAADNTATNEGSTWSSTFQLSFGKDSPAVEGATSDGELAGHFTDDPQDPALEAVQLLADLAMIHFEDPFFTKYVRGVVAVPPSDWVPSTGFDDQLLAGLTTNPVVTPVTLDGFFASVHDAGSRHLQSAGTGPTLPHGLAHQITTARLRLTGFDTAVRPRSTPVLTQLDQLLLASEAENLTTAAQSAGVATFGRSLDAQLSQVTFASGRSGRTITLTARTGSIPITILSRAPYRLVGTLVVASDKFQFPQGSSRSLVIDHPTTPVRIQVEARTSGDLPIQAVLQTADGSLVIAQEQLTVRSTATSIVGVVLTAVALVVLLAWWARTWRSGRRRRRAAKAGRGSTE